MYSNGITRSFLIVLVFAFAFVLSLSSCSEDSSVLATQTSLAPVEPTDVRILSPQTLTGTSAFLPDGLPIGTTISELVDADLVAETDVATAGKPFSYFQSVHNVSLCGLTAYVFYELNDGVLFSARYSFIIESQGDNARVLFSKDITAQLSTVFGTPNYYDVTESDGIEFITAQWHQKNNDGLRSKAVLSNVRDSITGEIGLELLIETDLPSYIHLAY